jgi:2-dehydro-3-deoxygalactonokinase
LGTEADWVAVDWGTSNLRAWGIGQGGEVVFSQSSNQGMGKLAPDAYASVLTTLVGGEFSTSGPPVDVLICGMAGARQGWLEAPYLEAPVELNGLGGRAVSPAMPDSRFVPRILPGVCQATSGLEDVMRGEETQLLGLSSLLPGFSGLVVMPGTHSKWVLLAGTRIERFSTSMTGELFEVVRQHSVLRHSVGAGDGDHAAGFEAGLEAGLTSPHLLTSGLFRIRAASLLSGRSPGWCAGYLSGLLIGAEIGGQRDWIGDDAVPLVGGPALCSLYARGFGRIGVATRIVDAADAVLAGLVAARQG